LFRRLAVLSLVCFALPLSAQPDQGGPDGFGYYYESSQDPGDSVRFSWLDPAGHTPISEWTPDPDDGWARIPLPGSFPFYCDTLDSIIVCTNGFLQHPTTSASYLNRPFPVPAVPSLICLFWDDLSTAMSGTVLRYDEPSGLFTAITWQNVVRFNTSETLSAQVLLFGDGRIRLNYLRAPANSRSSTIGIQGNSGTEGRYLEYVCDGQPPGHIPADSTSIVFFVRRLEHDVGVVRIVSPAGWVPAAQQVPVSATVRNYGSVSANFPVRAVIQRGRFPYDTLFDRSVTVTDLAPGDTFRCYFGDFLTATRPDSWLVSVRTDLSFDQYPRNDTAGGIAFSFPPVFGSVLATWDFPTIGTGFNLAGITFRPDSDRFYVAVNDPNRVVSFPSADPTVLRSEAFELQNFLGDDVIWGIVWDESRPGFWLTHTPEHGTGTILARYNEDGTYAGDTWDISGTIPDVWLAGIDCGPDNTLYATGIGGNNHVYHLDPVHRTVLGQLGSPTASWRACSWVGDHDLHLLTGGWNNHLMVQLDRSGNVIRTASSPDLADIDVYRPSPPPADSFIWAYRTRNNDLNTIERVSLGVIWSNTGIDLLPTPPLPLPTISVRPNPATGSFVKVRHPFNALPVRLELWDATGRLVSAVPVGTAEAVLPLTHPSGRRLAAGVYVLRLWHQGSSTATKLVVTTPD